MPHTWMQGRSLIALGLETKRTKPLPASPGAKNQFYRERWQPLNLVDSGSTPSRNIDYGTVTMMGAIGVPHDNKEYKSIPPSLFADYTQRRERHAYTCITAMTSVPVSMVTA